MSLRRFVISLVLLLGAIAAASSCGAPSPVGVDARTPGVIAADRKPHPDADDGDDSDDNDSDDNDGNEDRPDSLVSCRPLPYDSVTQTIGPKGGEIAVGRNWLLIPQGALRDPVRITAVAPSDTVAVVRFQPEGLRFLYTAQLVLTYDNCLVPRTATPRIALVTDAFRVLQFLASGVASPGDNRLMKGHRRVVGQLQHFSNYAVAW
jgi:hypothetical protein